MLINTTCKSLSKTQFKITHEALKTATNINSYDIFSDFQISIDTKLPLIYDIKSEYLIQKKLHPHAIIIDLINKILGFKGTVHY